MANMEGLVEIPLGEVPQGQMLPQGNVPPNLQEIPLGQAIPSGLESFRSGFGQGLMERLQGYEQTADQLGLLLSTPEIRPEQRQALQQQTRDVLSQRAAYGLQPGAQSFEGKMGEIAGTTAADLPLALLSGGRTPTSRLLKGAGAGAVMGFTQFEPTPQEKVRDAVMGAALGGTTSALFDTFRINANIVGGAMRRALKVPDIEKYFENSNVLSQMTGIDYTLGQATGSRALQSFENIAINAAGSSDQVLAIRNKQLQQSLRFLNDTVKQLGDPSVTPETVGTQLQKGLDDSVNRIVQVRGHLWDRYMDKAVAAVGDRPIGAPTNTLTEMDNIIAELDNPLAKYPKSVMQSFKATRNGVANNWTITDYKDALKKYGELAAGTGRPFKDLDQADQKRFFRQVVNALNKDLDAIQQSGGISANAVQNLRLARESWKLNSQRIDDIENTVIGSALNKGGKPLAPEELYSRFAKMPASEVKAIMPLLDKADPSIMNNVRARAFKDILEDATQETASGTALVNFDAASFVKKLSSYPNADIVFKNGAAKDYLTAIQGIKRIANMGNVGGAGASPAGAMSELGGLAGGAIEAGAAPNMVFVGRFLAKNLTPNRYAKLLMTPEGRRAVEVVSKFNEYPRKAVIASTGAIIDILTGPDTINYEEMGQVQLEPDMQR